MVIGKEWDVAVIGGGVVGCATARAFTLAGASTILIERGRDILCGASKGNSAILHTGFDAPPGSLELACMKAGYAEYREIRERLGLPLLETGALVVAWSEEDLARLEGILATAHGNGIADAHRIDRAELQHREPGLSEGALGALHVPGEHVIDPWSAPLAYLTQAIANGAEVRFEAEVTQGTLEVGGWSLTAGRETIRARLVANCAGLFGDRLENALTGRCDFEIRPRKGQFLVYDKAAARLASAIILPVPGERTKGVVVCRTAFGNLLVGPTAEDQESRTDSGVTAEGLQMLRSRGEAILPGLAGMPVTALYAGIRPGTEKKEYRISHRPELRWITVGGIRSTGLTAALGIARHVVSLSEFAGRGPGPASETTWPRVANLAEHAERDWQRPAHGRIICHCEMVTEREILAALEGPLPARDPGGLKRRTRAMMGRCQGFYCSAAVATLADGRLAVPLTCGAAHG